MHVAQILKDKGSRVFSVAPGTTIGDAARLLRRERIGAVIVIDGDDSVAGIISERDIMRGLADHGAPLLDKHVADLMTRSLFTTVPSASVEAVMEEMTAGRCRHMPVMEDGDVVGMISMRDVVRARLDQVKAESDQLKNYIANP